MQLAGNKEEYIILPMVVGHNAARSLSWISAAAAAQIQRRRKTMIIVALPSTIFLLNIYTTPKQFSDTT